MIPMETKGRILICWPKGLGRVEPKGLTADSLQPVDSGKEEPGSHPRDGGGGYVYVGQTNSYHMQ